MQWIYILRLENKSLYIGQTSRLITRLLEHKRGRGGINTSINEVENIIALYPLYRLEKFFYYNRNIHFNIKRIFFDKYFLTDFNINKNEQYDNLCVLDLENLITEKLLSNNPSINIKGGKYNKSYIDYNIEKNNTFIDDLPNCSCGLPCDIKKHEKKNILYFRCSKKNIFEQIIDIFEVYEEPCNFYQEYIKDKEYIVEWDNKEKIIYKLIKKSKWLKYLKGCKFKECIGGCGKEYDENKTLRYEKKAINLCFDCFIEKNQEIAKKYENISNNNIVECNISIDE